MMRACGEELAYGALRAHITFQLKVTRHPLDEAEELSA
jgi:hypothetical protein